MFRIYFTRKGFFVIQVLRFGFYWETIEFSGGNEFATYPAARDWALKIGLNKFMYEQRPIDDRRVTDAYLPQVYYGRGAKL